MVRTLNNPALTRLARAESAFLAAEFLAPVVRGRGVSVRIAGVRCAFRVVPPEFQGWGVFRPLSHKTAMLARPATAVERRRYLALFPQASVILCGRDRDCASAIVANPDDDRFDGAGPVEVRLTETCNLFDTLLARFDGTQFWFEAINPRADAAAASYLRRELADMTDPAALSRPGLTAGQREAYARLHERRLADVRADSMHRGELRFKSALHHVGAALRDFTEDGNASRVTYTIEGRRHTSIVGKHDLNVRSAGICLSGQDEEFDLNSLVGVVRERADFGW